jgi:hypothetical protein
VNTDFNVSITQCFYGHLRGGGGFRVGFEGGYFVGGRAVLRGHFWMTFQREFFVTMNFSPYSKTK